MMIEKVALVSTSIGMFLHLLLRLVEEVKFLSVSSGFVVVRHLTLGFVFFHKQSRMIHLFFLQLCT